jgi:uncharacterized Ntn-hydrolase superfamily protein
MQFRILGTLEAGTEGVRAELGPPKQRAVLAILLLHVGEIVPTDRLIDLRVEDNPMPLVELRRLLVLHRAYDKMNRGDEAVAVNKMDEALKEYSGAQAMVPENDEFVFWTAVTLVGNGRTDEAIAAFGDAMPSLATPASFRMIDSGTVHFAPSGVLSAPKSSEK